MTVVGTMFTWFVTAFGSAVVFFFKGINKRVLNGMLGSKFFSAPKIEFDMELTSSKPGNYGKIQGRGYRVV